MQIHRRKIRAWQMICVLSRFVSEDIVGQVTCYLHVALAVSICYSKEIFEIQIFSIYLLKCIIGIS